MIGVSYRIPESLKAEIEARAEQEGRSASAMAVRLLREALGPKEKAKAPEWADGVMEAFWLAYPRKTNKKKALDTMRSMILRNPDVYFWYGVIEDVRERFRSVENKKFIPHATTYLNGARWEDEVIHENATGNPTPSRLDRAKQQSAEIERHFRASGEASQCALGEDVTTVRGQMVAPGGGGADREW